MVKIKLVILSLFLFALSCNFVENKTISLSPDGTTEVLLSFTVFGDAQVFLVDKETGHKQYSFGILFADCNDRILKFSWSLDGSKIAWLISNSNRYTYGKRLVVFDVTALPDRVEKIIDNSEHDIVDFELSNERIIYWITDEVEYREHTF